MLNSSILITGSSGVIGSVLSGKLKALGINVIPFDIKDGYDICNKKQLHSKIQRISGIVHCAAIARVCECEYNSELCKKINIQGTKNIVECILIQDKKPWLLFLSSREVYGNSNKIPISENTPLNPINQYARSKVEGEKIINQARQNGLKTGIIRLSNVYGSINDYETRAIPAFVKAALKNDHLLINGIEHILDFIHINDVIEGIVKYIEFLQNKKDTEIINLVSGVPTNLKILAKTIIKMTNSKSSIIDKAKNDYEVAHFVGNKNKAKKLLNWSPKIALTEGLRKFIKEMQCTF
jgi:nucleoside-diphosphate-sugar epimerase